MQVPVNTALDSTMGVVVHQGCVPPSPPVPMFSVELPAPQNWPGGRLTSSGRLTRTVTHRGQAIVQGGHDQGRFLPHVTFPPNILLPVDILGAFVLLPRLN